MRPNNNLRLCQFFLLFVVVVFLSCSLGLGQQADTQIGAPPDAPRASVAESKGFFGRWAEFYRQDWWGIPRLLPRPLRHAAAYRRRSIRRLFQTRIGRTAVLR